MTRIDVGTPRRRIVLVEFLPSGGMFQFAFLFAQALAEAGHQVELVTGPDPEISSTTAGLTVSSLLPTWHPNANTDAGSRVRHTLRRVWRALLLVESWRRVIVHLRRTRPDVAQFGELRYALDTVAFLCASRLGRAQVMVDVAHNPLPYDVNGKNQSVEKSGALTHRLLGAAYASCDLVLVLGEGPRAELLSHFSGVRRTAVCGHGNYDAVLDRTSLQVPSSAPPSALFFGAWTKYKNIPLMLDAFELVRERLPEARLTLAGPVMPDVDLVEITARSDAIGNVDLRPGYVDLSDLPALFGSHRTVVFTYATVNISGSVHMAYTFGRPVVATDVGSMSDAVEHGVTGLLAAAEATAVAEALSVMLGDPAQADRMGAEAATRASQEASWTGVAERALSAYEDALGSAVVAPAH